MDWTLLSYVAVFVAGGVFWHFTGGTITADVAALEARVTSVEAAVSSGAAAAVTAVKSAA